MSVEQLNTVFISYNLHFNKDENDLSNIILLFVSCAPKLFSWLSKNVEYNFANSGFVLITKRFRDSFKLEYTPVVKFFYAQAHAVEFRDSWLVEKCIEFSLKLLPFCKIQKITLDPLYGFLRDPKCPKEVLRGIFAPLLCSPPPNGEKNGEKSNSSKFAVGFILFLRALDARLDKVPDLSFLDLDFWRHAIFNTFLLEERKNGEKLRKEFRKLLPYFSDAQQVVLKRELHVRATRVAHDQCCQISTTWNAFPSLPEKKKLK